MKTKLLSFSIAILAVATLFVGCTKTNVKYGNKRIVGTWTLTSENGASTSTSESKYTYAPSSSCYENSTYSSSNEHSSSYNGTSMSVNSKESDTYNGTTETDEYEYSYPYTLEITFNEDGTCVYKSTTKDEDDNGSSIQSFTGYWSWMDASLEKIGIEITGDDEMTMIIETLDKEELVVNYEYTENEDETYSSETSEYGSEYYCYNVTTGVNVPITKTTVHKSKSVSSGKQVFKKNE
jgi:hypothetical protein